MPSTYDIIIVGAGLSGIGAAAHLTRLCPDRSFLILEQRRQLGGTWDLFRYPGIRSDSDMHTMGYVFKPWADKNAIADGAKILKYVQDAAKDHQLNQHIRYDSQVQRASWSSEKGCWRLSLVASNGAPSELTCTMLYMCSGYYDYEEGHQPVFEGRERFKGAIVHPQKWPEDLDYRGKKVVVIGSGATAVTLLPNMAKEASHVTMLQRSPTYIVSWPAADMLARTLNWLLPCTPFLVYWIVRAKNIWRSGFVYSTSRTHPERLKTYIFDTQRKELGGECYKTVARHLTPHYNPWDERLCLCPDGDFFKAIKHGKASIVTDTIDHFTEDGIQLKSGETLDADIIVTATGLKMCMYGKINLTVDGTAVDVTSRYSYKGIALSGVPNFFACFGYINASWTLRADLISLFVCRVLNYFRKTGSTRCTPTLKPEDEAMDSQPMLATFMPGYIARAQHLMPKQGTKDPWVTLQSYYPDKRAFNSDLEDGVLRFNGTEPRNSAAQAHINHFNVDSQV